MRRIAPWLTVIALVACVPSNDPVVVDETPELSKRATWQASLTGTSTFPAVRGTSQIEDFGPYFEMEIGLTGAAPSTTYSWRIFPGTCATPGTTQFGPNQAYPNLVTNASGAVQAKRTISGPLNLVASYNVRVSTVATPVRIVACGDLQH